MNAYEQILQNRLAKGEISLEEYTRLVAVLEADTPSAEATPRPEKTRASRPKATRASPRKHGDAAVPPPAAELQTHKNSIGMEFVLIPAGSFMMGIDPNVEEGRSDETPQHNVAISKPFYLGKYEVTQAEWEVVMGGHPSGGAKEPDKPVVMVSWDDVQEFIRSLNRKERHSRYRLPTEAEWEYAARAGTSSAYSFGDDENELSGYAWYEDNSETTHPVGQKPANPWGLHDVHGNVCEWTQDWYDEKYYANSPGTDPKGPVNGSFRITRGGARFSSAWDCRSGCRSYNAQYDRSGHLGFRLALSSSEETVQQSEKPPAMDGDINADAFLDSEHFVWCVCSWLDEELKKEHGADIEKSNLTGQRMREAVQRAREELATSTETEISLPFAAFGQTGPIHFTRKLSCDKAASLVAEGRKDEFRKKIEEQLPLVMTEGRKEREAELRSLLAFLDAQEDGPQNLQNSPSRPKTPRPKTPRASPQKRGNTTAPDADGAQQPASVKKKGGFFYRFLQVAVVAVPLLLAWDFFFGENVSKGFYIVGIAVWARAVHALCEWHEDNS